VLKNALWDEIIDSNPMDRVDTRISRSQSTRIFLVLDEIKKLDKSKKCPKPVVKDAFLFCCFTGLRFSDVQALTWDKLHIESKKHFLYYTQLKTAKPERLPISESALKYLPPVRTSGTVFDLPNKKLTNKVLKTWMEEEGINKKVTFHVARHTFATLALNIGIDLKVVSKLLGHSEVRTTEIYAKIIDKTKEDAVQKLPKI
jgi:integrase